MQKPEPPISSETRQQLLRAAIRGVIDSTPPKEFNVAGLALYGIYSLMSEQNTMFEDVCDFHHKFGIAYIETPRMLPQIEFQARLQRMREEIDEYEEAGLAYLEAKEVGNKAEMEKQMEAMFDALIDATYFNFGTAHLHGFQKWNEGWKRVHEANMKKARASRENPGKHAPNPETGFCDIVKPTGWKEPSLRDLIQ